MKKNKINIHSETYASIKYHPGSQYRWKYISSERGAKKVATIDYTKFNSTKIVQNKFIFPCTGTIQLIERWA